VISLTQIFKLYSTYTYYAIQKYIHKRNKYYKSISRIFYLKQILGLHSFREKNPRTFRFGNLIVNKMIKLNAFFKQANSLFDVKKLPSAIWSFLNNYLFAGKNIFHVLYAKSPRDITKFPIIIQRNYNSASVIIIHRSPFQ